MPLDLTRLAQPADTKIVLVVVDGLGGCGSGRRGTELEEAATPNLDRLAEEGVVGLLEPVGAGITPGSGPGHFALFGYDPSEFEVGRGALSAAGLEVRLHPGDVAARGNLATLDGEGRVVDRRAGRISDSDAEEVVKLLADRLRVEEVEITLVHEAQHRVLLVLRGAGLDARVSDTDPQATGVPPRPPLALTPQADRTAAVVAEIGDQVRHVLADHPRANCILLRGFAAECQLPSLHLRHGITPGAVAVYPMYRGIARLVGMEVLGTPRDLNAQVELVRRNWSSFDFYFVHHKPADSAGEDGDFDAKVAAIEELDTVVPQLVELGADVLAVTGDHATPSHMAAHSWHPVPVVVRAERAGRDDVGRFGERWCRAGLLGRRPSQDLMAILLASAGRLAKYGA